MDKTESIVRRILGWKLNNLDKWYDHENSIFIDKNEFQPYENIEHAMQIVKRLEAFGYQYTNKDDVEVSFDNQLQSCICHRKYIGRGDYKCCLSTRR